MVNSPRPCPFPRSYISYGPPEPVFWPLPRGLWRAPGPQRRQANDVGSATARRRRPCRGERRLPLAGAPPRETADGSRSVAPVFRIPW